MPPEFKADVPDVPQIFPKNVLPRQMDRLPLRVCVPGLTCEKFSDVLVLPAPGADEEEPGWQQLVVNGQQLADAPGTGCARPRLHFPDLHPLIH